MDLSGTMQGAGGVGGLLSESQLITSNPITFNSFSPTYDGNGNISEYLASNGSVAAHFEYDPFGNTVVNTEMAVQFTYRFSTKPLDAESGTYYYGYRYYDPSTGRWPSRDPIGEDGGMNLYAFVGNDGVYRCDFIGLACKCCDVPTRCKIDVTWTKGSAASAGFAPVGTKLPNGAVTVQGDAGFVVQVFAKVVLTHLDNLDISDCKLHQKASNTSTRNDLVKYTPHDIDAGTSYEDKPGIRFVANVSENVTVTGGFKATVTVSGVDEANLKKEWGFDYQFDIKNPPKAAVNNTNPQ